MSDKKTQPVIISARRTPVGAFLGSLTKVSATQLGAWAIEAALDNQKLNINECIMGSVLQAGLGQNPARQSALNAGLPETISAVTINKVCGSGLQSVMQGAQSIRAGENTTVIAGGMENMSGAPHLTNVRSGLKFGGTELVDHMQHDGLTCAFEGWGMGSAAEWTAKEFQISREAQDEFAAESHQRAAKATKEGWFNEEIIVLQPEQIKQRAGIKQDEGIRPDSTSESLSKLRPAFSKDGTVTAGNASQISDGAAAIVLASAAEAESLDVQPMAKIIDYNTVGVEPKRIFTAPGLGISELLERNNLKTKDVDLFEINEAFAVQVLQNMAHLGLDASNVNVGGGGVALGHPIGASGARVLVSLIHHLKRMNLSRGVASLCLGGGNAVSMLIERG